MDSGRTPLADDHPMSCMSRRSSSPATQPVTTDMIKAFIESADKVRNLQYKLQIKDSILSLIHLNFDFYPSMCNRKIKFHLHNILKRWNKMTILLSNFSPFPTANTPQKRKSSNAWLNTWMDSIRTRTRQSNWPNRLLERVNHSKIYWKMLNLYFFYQCWRRVKHKLEWWVKPKICSGQIWTVYKCVINENIFLIHFQDKSENANEDLRVGGFR